MLFLRQTLAAPLQRTDRLLYHAPREIAASFTHLG